MFPFPPPEGFDRRLIAALEHPVRVRFLELLAEHGRLSPREAFPLLRNRAATLGKLVYHARVLDQFQLIAPADKRAPEGGVYFRLTDQGEAALAMLGLMPGTFDS
jgi:DNA-binding transcriptional ArsR family regulator